MSKRATLAVLLPTLALTLVGCTGEDGGKDDGGAGAEDLGGRLSAARTVLDDAASLELDLATKALPSGVTGLLDAAGTGTHAPAFEGDVTVSLKGVPVKAEVVSVDGKVYAKTGFAPDFVPLDPATIGAPDPAALVAADDGISSLLEETDDLEDGGESRDGRDVLTTITGTIAGRDVRALIPTAQADATFDATYRLTEDDVLRDVTLKGLFYESDEPVVYTIAVTASDDDVEITAP
ncbi:LppX_LprAFG lipoprotein [Mumia zhuanghuii]|uniref:LppX_LprAFG lipoprotein n=2 Tax=Mumia TaxID=1546255 RepID=A0ABW1QMW7_9ACTN|nr:MULTISPECIES: LppX_LprAFG lipoprotein [Mumia]KAA1423380.1 LppX_LprAFG lipoprotein [Mumia zhuanghuii]